MGLKIDFEFFEVEKFNLGFPYMKFLQRDFLHKLARESEVP